MALSLRRYPNSDGVPLIPTAQLRPIRRLAGGISG